MVPYFTCLRVIFLNSDELIDKKVNRFVEKDFYFGSSPCSIGFLSLCFISKGLPEVLQSQPRRLDVSALGSLCGCCLSAVIMQVESAQCVSAEGSPESRSSFQQPRADTHLTVGDAPPTPRLTTRRK